MTLPTITGARGSEAVNQTLRKIDMSDRILKLQPSAAPLTVFVKNLSKKPAANAEFKWTEDDLEDRVDATTGAVGGTTAATIPVGKASMWAEHDLMYNTRTAELYRVTGVSGSNVLVVRGASPAAINNADELLKAGAAQPEGDTSRPARSGVPTTKTNYTEIFRRSVELTETWRHTDQIVEDDDEEYQKGLQGIEHLRDIEGAFLFGKPVLDVTGSQPRRSTGGALSYISTNQTAVGGTLTEATFFGALRPGMRFGSVGASGSKEKLALAAPLAVDVLNGFARGKVQVTDQGRTAYGVKVVDYISPHGTLHVVTHWALGDTAKFAGTIIILDLEQIRYRYLANKKGSRDTMYLPDRQANDADTKKGEFLTEAGLQFGLEKTHARIDGITG